MILLSRKGKSKEESDSHADFSVIFKAEAYMESTIKDLMERRSCRSYSDKQITDVELNTVLEAGLIAPSAMNRQSPIFVVVQDKETIAKLSKMNAAIMHSDKDPFYGAPTVIIVLADRNNANAVADGSLAMGNLMNAAHAIGLGSCWINRAYEEFESDEGKALLRKWGVNGEYIGVGHCILGYPKEEAKPHPINEGRVFFVK